MLAKTMKAEVVVICGRQMFRYIKKTENLTVLAFTQKPIKIVL